MSPSFYSELVYPPQRFVQMTFKHLEGRFLCVSESCSGTLWDNGARGGSGGLVMACDVVLGVEGSVLLFLSGSWEPDVKLLVR